jgi:uncharacterized protein (TIGR02453 family)
MKRSPITLDAPAPQMPFKGFPESAFDFLHGLKKNNNKEWFENHRETYENDLREPSKLLVGAMSEALASAKLPLIADQKRSLFRINRDIRFSKDKSPYKTHIGIVFPFEGAKEDEWIGMYLGFEPEGKDGVKTYIGGGCHMPSSSFLKRVRNKVASNYKELEKLIAEKNFKKEFPKGVTDGGESLKRMPKGFDEGHPAEKWLKMKSYSFGSDLTKKELMSKDLPKLITQKVKAAEKVMQFFAET